MIDKEAVSLRDFEFLGKDKIQLARSLAKLKKDCMNCKESKTDVYILRCLCMFCPKCIKELLLKANESLFFNPFEATRLMESMCVCPNHKYAISPNLLKIIYSTPKIVEYSMRAFKRQIAESNFLSRISDK